MFADDTNLFLSHKNIKNLFLTANKELRNIHEWFKSNKLSLNYKKTKYSFFHPAQKSDNLPLHLPKLAINNTTIERQPQMRFLGVLLDENLTWKYHINTIKSKISKNLGLLFKARYIIKNHCLKQLYFSYIHSYLTYANIAWGSTHKSKLVSLYRQQKHAARIIYFKDKLTHAEPLLKKMNALNVYQLNIFQTLNFMFKTKHQLVPLAFQNIFSTKINKYTLKSSNLTIPFKKSKLTQFSISYRGPHLWNTVLRKKTKLKNTINLNIFKRDLKQTIMSTKETFDFF